MELTDIKGIGKRKEERLRADGFKCAEQVARANINRLDDTSGLDAAEVLADAHSKVPEYAQRKTREDIQRPFVCSDCGKRFSNHGHLNIHIEWGDGEGCPYDNWSKEARARRKKSGEDSEKPYYQTL